MPIGPARMPLMDHLGELRRRLAIVVVSLLVTSVVVYVATPTLIDIMLDPIRDVFESNELTVLSVLGGFTIRFKVAFFFSLIICTPVIVWEVMGFFLPALKPSERRWVIPTVAAMILLFFLGMGFCYLVIQKPTIGWMVAQSRAFANVIPGAEDFLNIMMLLEIGFGFAFQLPLIVFYLSILHLVPYKTFRSQWRYVYIVLLVISSVVTPDASPVTMILMFAALIALYEIALLIARFVLIARDGKESLKWSREEYQEYGDSIRPHEGDKGGTVDARAAQDSDARRGRGIALGHPGLTVLRLVALAACLVFAIMLATAPPREAPRVGTIGTGCSYELDTWSGTLTIYPTDGASGEMARVRDALSDDGDLLDAIRSVTVKEGVVAPADSSYLFGSLRAMESLDLSGLDTSRATDMKGMFQSCGSLRSLDLSGLDTSRVTDMEDMFSICLSISSLDLSPLDTSQVTNMKDMFSNCFSLRSLDLSPLDTSRVTDMWGMFQGCSSLRSLDLSPLDTSQVQYMGYMFSNCSSLSSLDLSPLKTSRVTDMGGMFWGCSSLSSLDLSPLDTSRVTDMSSPIGFGMFEDCSSLSSLDLSPLDTSQVTKMSGMFRGCSSLSSLDLSPLKTSQVTDMSGMFKGCSSLRSLDLSPLDTSQVTDMWGMFADCSSLSSLDLSPLKTSQVQSMGGMFDGCSSLRSLDLSPLDTSQVQHMGYMFADCSSLASLDLSSLKTLRVESMWYMFSGCSSLRSLDLSPLDTSQVTNMKDMFSGCASLRSLDLPSLKTSRVMDMSDMFDGCSSLRSLDLSRLDTSKVTRMDFMFSGCSSLASLDLSRLDTSKVTRMGCMFSGCSSLASLDLSGWDTSEVTGMWGMFFGCSSLSSLAVGEGFGGVLSTDRHTALPAGVGGWGWHSARDKRWLTLGELSSSRQGVADTYTAPEAWRSLVSPQAAQTSP